MMRSPREFKRTKPQEELGQEEVIIVQDSNGNISYAPKSLNNLDYQQFLKMEAEGYEAWWHDEEVDFEQSWEKEKAGLTKDLEEAQEPTKPVKKARKKKVEVDPNA